MSIGDILNPKRVRTQSNERVDDVDAKALSQAARDHLDAYSRAIEALPRNGGAAVPTGLIFEGFGLTLNPTGPNDNKVRVQSATGVAFDANGRMLIKENGVTVDLTLGAGNSQIYAYFIEDNSDSTTRRFISVTSPYTESPQVIPTKLKGDVGYWVRAGDQTSIVASDVVNGQTTALCFLGVANNAAGAVTMTGYDVVSAPNGAYATNRITSVLAPTTPPQANTSNGSIAHIHGLINAALYAAGQAAWAGSDFLTPNAGNNFGAYKYPPGGADKAFREALGYVTIGNGTTVFGDFNTSDIPGVYANANALLTAAIASLPTNGGTIVLKRGVALTGFNSATVTMPASKTVEIIGDHHDQPLTPQITFAATESLTCNASGALILRNLYVKFHDSAVFLTTSPMTVRDCFFECTALTEAGAALQGAAAVSDLDVVNMHLKTVLTTATVNTMAIRVIGTADRVHTNHVFHACTGLESGTISLQDVWNDVLLLDTVCEYTGGAPTGMLSPVIEIQQQTTTSFQNRIIDGVTIRGHASAFCAVSIGDPVLLNSCGQFTIRNVDVPLAKYGIYFPAGTQNASSDPSQDRLLFQNCRFTCQTASTFSIFGIGAMVDVTFEDCYFIAPMSAGDGTAAVHMWFSGCTFALLPGHIIAGSSVSVYVQHCVIFGVASTTAADIWVIKVTSTTSVHAEFVDNEIVSFDNVAYAGADATSFPRIFDVRDAGGATIICNNNRATGTMGATSGNTIKGCYLVRYDSLSGADAASTGGSIEMMNNWSGSSLNVGGSQDCMMLLKCDHQVPWVVDITNNHFHISWDSRANHVQMGSLVALTVSASYAGSLEQFRYDENFVGIKNQSASNISVDVVRIAAVGAPTWTIISFRGNECTQSNTGFAFDFAGGFGYALGAGVNSTNLMVLGNVCGRRGSAASGFMAMLVSLAPALSFPAVPAIGTDFADNLQLQRQ